MPAKQVEVGQQYGRLTIGRFECRKVGGKSRRFAVCVCDCGTDGVIRRADGMLRDGVPSCGCYKREQSRERAIANSMALRTHGLTGTEVHRAWTDMISRCYRPKQKAYQHYGAKGIRACAAIRSSPQALKDLIGEAEGDCRSLDRFPNGKGNYTCGRCEECLENGWALNVRWATWKEQCLNRPTWNVYLEAFGLRMTRSQWQELTGMDSRMVHLRTKRGWTLERALTTPDSKGNCYRPERANVGGF